MNQSRNLSKTSLLLSLKAFSSTYRLAKLSDYSDLSKFNYLLYSSILLTNKLSGGSTPYSELPPIGLNATISLA